MVRCVSWVSVVCVATLASTFLFFIYALPTAALLALPYDRTLVLTTLHTPPAHDEVPFTFLSSLLAYLPTLVTTATPVSTVRGMVPVQRARESEMAAPLRAFSFTIPHARHNAADLHPRAPHVGARASCLLVYLSRVPARPQEHVGAPLKRRSINSVPNLSSPSSARRR